MHKLRKYNLFGLFVSLGIILGVVFGCGFTKYWLDVGRQEPAVPSLVLSCFYAVILVLGFPIVLGVVATTFVALGEIIDPCEARRFKRNPPYHDLGEWEYIANDSCEQVGVCSRCGLKERRIAPHRFDEWEYIANDSCEQVGVCSRCGYEKTRDYHDWVLLKERAPFSGGSTISKICTRCKEKKGGICPHCGSGSSYVVYDDPWAEKTHATEYCSDCNAYLGSGLA